MSDPEREHFDKAFKSWAGQPPVTPPDRAARQVLAGIAERRQQSWLPGHWLPAASAAAALMLVLVIGWVTLPNATAPRVDARPVHLPPLEENVVLLWLDDQTPLYLTVAPPATKGGS